MLARHLYVSDNRFGGVARSIPAEARRMTAWD